MTSIIYYLALNMYHESRGESDEGKKSVCKVVLNRTHTRQQTVLEVIYDEAQFSWTEDHLPDYPRNNSVFLSCLKLAEEAVVEFLNGDNLHGADLYHATYVSPYWSKSPKVKKIAQIGNHIFYKEYK